MSIAELLILKEAVHSVAIEHEQGCNCVTCRAAGGDRDAWSDIVRAYYNVKHPDKPV